MTAKIIKLSDYLSRPRRKKGRPTHLPEKYAIWVQVSLDEKGDEVIEYDISDDKFSDTKAGRALLGAHLGSIMLDLCLNDNPELIFEVLERLTEFLEDE